MNRATRDLVRRRAGDRCEYCQLHQDDSSAALHVEHIRPRKHGGTDDDGNLCLACIDCNLHKGSNLTGIDPLTDAVTSLFHPREQVWEEHFKWEGIHIIGISNVGRTTVGVLAMNNEEQLELRMSGH
ncbi:MAG: HNH endonuclease [Akkermansiaceae bacterium]|nr:HNH endonuclease [Akkermansiaceae bacterium]